MERHVNLLATLFTLWGALAAVVGLSMLLLSAGAAAELMAPQGSPVSLAAGVTAAVFAFVGAFALVWGGAHVWSAALLRRRRALGRIAGLALALVNLLVLPFGTALAIYTFWVLLAHEGRRLFEVPA